MNEILEGLAWPELAATLTDGGTMAKCVLAVIAMFVGLRAAAWFVVGM